MNDYGLMAVESGHMLALRGADVAARISGLLAETTLVQKYRNDTDANLELSYTFPLPVSGTLLSFSVAIGQKTYQGEVVPRVKAEVEYEKAIGKGNSAFRLQEIRAGMYNATLGNVLAGESVEITLAYAEPLAWNGKCIRYRLPTTIAPRYGEPGGMQPWQRPETSIAAAYPLSLKVTIVGTLAQCAIACPSHKISMKSDHEVLSIMLAKGATMDRDFILEIECHQVESVGISATACGTHIAMLTLLPPEVEDVGNTRDAVLVIDCSGSMQGDSLALAKEGVLLALGSLEPNARFGIVAFGTKFMQFDKELQPANRKNLDMARRWVGYLDNLGGTDINGALELALKLHDGHAMDILLLSDGQDWQAGKSINTAKTMGVRLFSLGIGSAVAEDAIRQMADDTGGACELVAPTEDMSERIYRHFNRMRQPRMSRLDITWPASPIWESRPARACFAGDAYTVFAALPEASDRDVNVAFEFSGQGTKSIDVPLLRDDASSDAIVRVGARQRLASLPAKDRQDWAVKYQLMTGETDYLITVERADGEKATDLPALQVQPQMLPAGWGGTSSVRYSPALYESPMVCASAASADYSHLEVPSVVRRSARVEVTALEYGKFIEKLQKRARRSLLPGLPKTCSDLKKLALQPALRNLIDRLLADHSDAEVLAAFYQALLDHDGSDQLESGTIGEISRLIASTRPDHALVGLLLDCLNVLYRRYRGSIAVEALANSGVDRYDIPSFLRKQAD